MRASFKILASSLLELGNQIFKLFQIVACEFTQAVIAKAFGAAISQQFFGGADLIFGERAFAAVDAGHALSFFRGCFHC